MLVKTAPGVRYNLKVRGELWTPEIIEAGQDLAGLDAALEQVPNRPAVFLVWPRGGLPYLGKTSLLRRRLLRMLRERTQPSRLLNLRPVVSRVEYRLTASWLETMLVFYQQARRRFPEAYRKLMNLRMPPYVEIVLSNPFPRSRITAQLGGSSALYYGPFRTRSSAEQFESAFLDLFQMRRCQEDLAPSSGHPGCLYGEMNMCLRPCQQVVGPEEYAAEVNRAAEFLSTEGRSLYETVTRLRDRMSEEMNFEEAARQHKRAEKIQQALKLRDELVRDVDCLNGVAVTASTAPGCVELWFMLSGCWQAPTRLSLEPADGRPLSLDCRLRKLAASLKPGKPSQKERQEHLALLARWRYSSSSEGEWIPFDGLENLPYRKLVRAISSAAGS